MESKGCSTKNMPMSETECVLLSKSPHNFFAGENDSESSADEDAMIQDAGLGGLRKGIQSITNHARSTLADCKTDEARDEMARRLESSTLRLIKAEKSFLQTASIISNIVDDVVTDDEEEALPIDLSKLNLKEKAQSIANVTEGSSKNDCRPFTASSDTVPLIRSKMMEMFNERVTDYEKSLTDELLRKDPKFVALQEQIALERKDRETLKEIHGAAGDSPRNNNLAIEDSHANERNSSSESDEDYDESVLPSIDPITMNPIENPVRNRFCNHVFDERSIANFIETSSEPKCPIFGCRNPRVLEVSHFEKNAQLTKQVKKKNAKLPSMQRIV